MKKLDIMNSRKDETWEMKNGKVQRVIPDKIEGPVVKEGIKEIIVSANVEEKEEIKSEEKILKKKSK